MSLVEMASALRKRWRVIVLAVLVTLSLAAVYVALATPKYTANAQLFAAGREPTNPSQQYSVGAFIQGQMSSFVDIINKDPVLDPVVRQLHLPYSARELAGHVSADNPVNTALINISVTDTSAATAASIANALSTEFASYIDNLEAVGSQQSPVKLTVVQPALKPSSPSSPKVALDVVAALLVGLALGAALALVRESTDASVTDLDDLKRRFGVVGLGQIPFDRATPKQPVVLGNDGSPRRVEALRQLRTNLQFVQIDSQPKSILISSSVRDEGKTTTACNLAAALAQLGVDVILVEGDLRRPRIAEYLGMENAVGLTSVLMGWTSWRDAVRTWGPEEATIRVLPCGPRPPNPTELLASESMDRLLTEMEDNCDVVIIDGPPLLPVADSALLAATVSGSILVVREGKTRHQQVRRAIEALDAVEARLYGVVLNMSRGGASVDNYEAYYELGADPAAADRERGDDETVIPAPAEPSRGPGRPRRRDRSGKTPVGTSSGEQ